MEHGRGGRQGEGRQERRELFSRQVRAGRRTYYLDVKENARKDMYLVISESRRNPEGTSERTNVMVFEEDMGNFRDAFEDVAMFIRRARMPQGLPREEEFDEEDGGPEDDWDD